jgi:hypothetical protein
MSSRKIGVYNHVTPPSVAALMLELAPSVNGMFKRVTSIPMRHGIDARIRMMEAWPGYQQVLTISNPPLETIAGPGDSPLLARLANDELKRICDIARQLPRLGRLPAAQQCRGVSRRGGPCHRTGSERGPNFHQCQRHGSRRCVALPDFRACNPTDIASASGCIRRAMPDMLTIKGRLNRSSRYGRSLDGRMRQASR